MPSFSARYALACAHGAPHPRIRLHACTFARGMCAHVQHKEHVEGEVLGQVRSHLLVH